MLITDEYAAGREEKRYRRAARESNPMKSLLIGRRGHHSDMSPPPVEKKSD